MVVYDLVCDGGHTYEGWFGSAEQYSDQLARGLLTCPVCNSQHVSKKLSAPAILSGKPDSQALEASVDVAQVVQYIRQMIEQHTENVGSRFAEEARKIHQDEAPERAIRGTASKDELLALQEDGIDCLPIPDVDNPTLH